MNAENKNRMEFGVKAIAIVLWAILTIATCAGVWNFCPEKAVKFLAVLLFICNGIAVVYAGIKTVKKYKEIERNLSHEN